MQISTEVKNDVAVLKCKGALDADTISLFKKRTYELFDGGTVKFVLDASDLSFVDSMGLGVVISLLRRTREKKGDVKIFGLNNEILKIFEITRLNKLFDICRDISDAFKKFS